MRTHTTLTVFGREMSAWRNVRLLLLKEEFFYFSTRKLVREIRRKLCKTIKVQVQKQLHFVKATFLLASFNIDPLSAHRIVSIEYVSLHRRVMSQHSQFPPPFHCRKLLANFYLLRTKKQLVVYNCIDACCTWRQVKSSSSGPPVEEKLLALMATCRRYVHAGGQIADSQASFFPFKHFVLFEISKKNAQN